MERMEKMKVYKVYWENVYTEECYKEIVPAYSEEEAIEFVGTDGKEIISIKESIPSQEWVLSEHDFTRMLTESEDDCIGKTEVLIITRALSQIGLFSED